MARRALAAAALALLHPPAPAAAADAPSLPRHATLGASVGPADGGHVKILSVLPGTPAAKAGLRAGDVVDAIGDRQVADAAGFVAAVKAGPAGRPIAFALRRDGAPLTLPVTLAAAPDEQDPQVATLYEAVAVDGSLRRTLVTMPRGGGGRRPALLIVGGIGCYSVDTADPDDSYRRIAHDLGRRGIVVMRLEKSGVGDSQGPPCPTVDLDAEMKSYAAALDALGHHAGVDPARLYIFGHSIGTLIAPRLALKRKVAGLIVAEGVGRNWIEYELANLRRQLVLDRIPPAETDESMRLKELCMHRLLVERQDETAIEAAEPGCKEMNAYPAPAAYMREAAALNIVEPWTKLSLPLLVIYGTADFVTEEADHRRIADIVNAAHPGLATLKLIDGMDHLLKVGGTEQEDFDRGKKGGKGAYDPALSAALADWLCARETCAHG